MRTSKLQNLNQYTAKIILASVLIAVVVISRVWVPYPANVSPVAAIAIFGGAVLPWRWALTLPLAGMIVSDLFLGVHDTILFTWGSFALIALLSCQFFGAIKIRTVVGSSLGASVLFFLVSNFGVWMQGRLYTMDWAGLIQCYVNALPFFRNTLAGDLMFTTAIFGAYVLARSFLCRIQNASWIQSLTYFSRYN